MTTVAKGSPVVVLSQALITMAACAHTMDNSVRLRLLAVVLPHSTLEMPYLVTKTYREMANYYGEYRIARDADALSLASLLGVDLENAEQWAVEFKARAEVWMGEVATMALNLAHNEYTLAQTAQDRPEREHHND